MKTFVMFIFALLLSVGLSAQEYSEKSSFGYDVEKGIITNEVLEVGGLVFDIYQSDSGSKYIKAISKKGNPYPVWIGEKTEDFYDVFSVYKTKNNKYCYYKLGKSGYPYAVWLDKS